MFATEVRFRQLADAMPQIVWAAQPNGAVDYYNEQWYQYTGQPRNQTGDASWEPVVHPEDLQILRVRWRHSVETGERYDIDARLRRHSDGAYRWHLIRALAIHDAGGAIVRWFGTCTDVHDQRVRDNALRVSEARLADIVRSSLDCIIGMDADGKIIEWNPAAEAVFGYGRASAVGREMATLILPPEMRSQYRQAMTRYLETGESSIIGRRLEFTALRKDGTAFPVELSITPTQLGDQQTFTGFCRDITDRRQAEAEREELLARERAARGEAEQANRMKDEFLATLSHELRTPLNAILGWIQILRSGGTEEEIAEGLAIIERNARAQTQIIDDLLDMSRIISGKIRLDVQKVELAETVEAAIGTVRPAAVAKDIRIQAILDPLPHPVSGDPNRLQQVFWNLLSNAVKFTPKGGRIQVRQQRINSHIEVSVHDSGAGISSEFLPHVFDRFRQADASTARRHGGLGLGLAIVKQLVELHGGFVQAASDGLDKGSTFTVVLPQMVVVPDGRESVRRHPESHHVHVGESECVQISGVRVLVVDDEHDARMLVKRLLEDCDAVVSLAVSATEAMEMLSNNEFDVLVSDIGMPGEDGNSLIKRVRQLPPNYGKVPALALTAYARAEDRVRSVVSGFHAHIAKPVEPAELIAMVASLAGRTSKSSGQ
ncbi:MAG: PAS domain S-box protein [Phycisphaerae bacterium]|nr:PAS domain S-box protein [Phycisphaerae bacterium]